MGHGFERDGKGVVFCCVVDAGPRGHIIGKATHTECWYGWCGREYYQSAGFTIQSKLMFDPKPTISREPHVMIQEGYGILWYALADTPHGKIPAKASCDKCWYTFGGKEYMVTSGFVYFKIALWNECPSRRYTWCGDCYLNVQSSVLIKGEVERKGVELKLLSGRSVRPCYLEVLQQTCVGDLEGAVKWIHVDDSSPWEAINNHLVDFISRNSGLRIDQDDPLGIFDDDIVSVVVTRHIFRRGSEQDILIYAC